MPFILVGGGCCCNVSLSSGLGCGSSVVSWAHLYILVSQVVTCSYQQTVMSTLEGSLWCGVVSSAAASGLMLRGVIVATMTIAFV